MVATEARALKPMLRLENFLNFDLLRPCGKAGNTALAGEIRDVRFGSKADIEMVRQACPLSAY